MDQPLLEHTDALLEQACRVMDAVEETGWSPPAVLGTLAAIEALAVALARLGPAVAQALEPVSAVAESVRGLVAASPRPTPQPGRRKRPRSASAGPARPEDWLTRDGRVAEQLWSDQTRWPDSVAGLGGHPAIRRPAGGGEGGGRGHRARAPAAGLAPAPGGTDRPVGPRTAVRFATRALSGGPAVSGDF